MNHPHQPEPPPGEAIRVRACAQAHRCATAPLRDLADCAWRHLERSPTPAAALAWTARVHHALALLAADWRGAPRVREWLEERATQHHHAIPIARTGATIHLAPRARPGTWLSLSLDSAPPRRASVLLYRARPQRSYYRPRISTPTEGPIDLHHAWMSTLEHPEPPAGPIRDWDHQMLAHAIAATTGWIEQDDSTLTLVMLPMWLIGTARAQTPIAVACDDEGLTVHIPAPLPPPSRGWGARNPSDPLTQALERAEFQLLYPEPTADWSPGRGRGALALRVAEPALPAIMARALSVWRTLLQRYRRSRTSAILAALPGRNSVRCAAELSRTHAAEPRRIQWAEHHRPLAAACLPRHNELWSQSHTAFWRGVDANAKHAALRRLADPLTPVPFSIPNPRRHTDAIRYWDAASGRKARPHEGADHPRGTATVLRALCHIAQPRLLACARTDLGSLARACTEGGKVAQALCGWDLEDDTGAHTLAAGPRNIERLWRWRWTGVFPAAVIARAMLAYRNLRSLPDAPTQLADPCADLVAHVIAPQLSESTFEEYVFSFDTVFGPSALQRIASHAWRHRGSDLACALGARATELILRIRTASTAAERDTLAQAFPRTTPAALAAPPQPLCVPRWRDLHQWELLWHRPGALSARTDERRPSNIEHLNAITDTSEPVPLATPLAWNETLEDTAKRLGITRIADVDALYRLGETQLHCIADYEPALRIGHLHAFTVDHDSILATLTLSEHCALEPGGALCAQSTRPYEIAELLIAENEPPSPDHIARARELTHELNHAAATRYPLHATDHEARVRARADLPEHLGVFERGAAHGTEHDAWTLRAPWTPTWLHFVDPAARLIDTAAAELVDHFVWDVHQPDSP